MNTASKYFITAALALMMLTGCNNIEDQPYGSGKKDFPEFTANIDGALTRASGHSWDIGDEIGISGSNRSNVCYVTNNGDGIFAVKTRGNQIYFQNDGEVVFTAYYPWSNQADNSEEITADTRLQNNQKKFDFLWSQASGSKENPDVEFKFSHRMTKLVITVNTGVAMDFNQIKTGLFSFEGMRHIGSFNTTDGSTSADSGSSVWSFSEFADINDTEKTITISLIVFPQLFNELLKFSAEFSNPDSINDLFQTGIDFTNANKELDGEDAKNEWVAGRQYNLSLTLHKTGVALDNCTINSWNKINDEISVD